jgi:hypothetical protein
MIGGVLGLSVCLRSLSSPDSPESSPKYLAPPPRTRETFSISLPVLELGGSSDGRVSASPRARVGRLHGADYGAWNSVSSEFSSAVAVIKDHEREKDTQWAGKCNGNREYG